jgi:hypothetical protein
VAIKASKKEMGEEENLSSAMAALSEAIASGNAVNQPLLLSLIKGLDEKVGLLINAQKEGVKTAMDAAEKAVAKAESAADKRFEALNELRGMAADWRTEFARQSTVDLQVKGLETRLYNIDLLLRDQHGRGSGQVDLVKWVFGAAVAGAGLIAVIEFVLRFQH